MVDYSKWKNIEVSDDEDDVHPNIDTPSLFRWRHQARVDRMEVMEKEKEKFELEKKEMSKKKSQLEKMADKCEGDNSKYKADIDVISSEILEKQQELEKLERLAPWNIDTIGKDGFSKTIINIPKEMEQGQLTEEDKASRLDKFTKENESLLKKYGMLHKFEDTKKFLLENQHLACEETSSYLILWCVNLAVEEKFELMDHVSHQCIAMEFLLNLAKQIKTDPRSCISNFFTKMAQLEAREFKTDFHIELDAFRVRIRKRAEDKLEAAKKEEEEEMSKIQEQEDVLNSLPDDLQKCFITQDIPLLQETLATMKVKDVKKYMLKCIKVGLWVPADPSCLDELETEDDDSNDEAFYKEIENKDDPESSKDVNDKPVLESE